MFPVCSQPVPTYLLGARRKHVGILGSSKTAEDQLGSWGR